MHLMAKCTTGNDSIRQGYLDSARAWSCSNYYNHQSHGQSEIFQSETFKKRKRAEYRNIYSKNISTLEQNIIRVFEESLHSDLYIINGDNVLQTNCCILKTRSPHLYNVLEKYFRYNKNLIKCYLNTPTIFHQLRGFLRLLYCNSDVTTQEQHLIELLIANSEEKKLINGFIKNKKSCSIDDDDDDDNVDVSPNTSEMADSGLETGSGSTHENTESENSATDVEESHVTDYVSTDDDFIRVSLSGDVEKTCNKNAMTTHRHNECSTKHIPINNQEEGTETISSDVCACGASESKQPNQKHCIISNINDKTKTCEIADDDVDDDDVIRYENEVLNDPFYESDSNGNEQSGSFVPTGSFEFIEPGNLSPSNSTRQEFTNQSVDKNACTNLETRSMIVENLRYGLSQSNDLSLKKSSSSINNYYFIDASSLNDETEIAAMNATTDESMSGVSLPTYLENVSYIPTNSIIDSNEQNNSFINRKSSLQSGHEKIAEFERELKLTEYLKPIVEPRKIKRADSMTDEKIIEEKPSFEKESLVVEIKEADSGESNHPSPCIDNNKRVQRENNVECCLDDENSTDNLSNSRRSSLVRQNTFELESGGERLSYLQQEYERRQGNLVFKNSIPQYSGHRVDGDLTYDGTNYSSMPYFPTESRTRSRRDVNSSRYIFTDAIADCSKSLNQNYGNVDDDSNGIYPISKSASDKLLATGSETDDSSITDCNSLPATFDFPCDTGRKSTVKRSKRDELTPIISGGVSTNDYLKSVDSPAVRRKSELTPIVSGDSVSTNTTTVKTRSTRMSSSMNNAWVVDMSDCGRGNSRSNNDSSSSSMSQSYSFSESANKSVNKIKSTDKPSSLGFFVNLNDIHCPKQQTSLHNSNTKNNKSNNNLDKEKNDQDMKQQSCEFFVDISKESMKMKKIPKKTENHNSKSCASGGSVDKKNIFSIFIDLNEQDNEKKSVDGEKSDRLSTHNPDEASRECDSKSSPQESRSIEKKPSVFMFIDSDSPVVRRRTLSASKPIFQRHSWNMDKFPVQNNGHVKETTFRREHKRAHSVSIDPGLQKILQVKTDGSRCSLSQIGRATSLQTSVTTREKEMTSSACTESFDYGIRDTPPNSHVELINDNLRSCVKRHEYNELIHNDNMCSSTEASGDLKVSEDDRSDVWDKTATESTEGHTRKSETFDISSGSASGPSPGSDNQVFELGDYTNEPSTFTDRRQIEHPIPSKIAETHKSLTETIKKIECEFNKQEYNTDENYVDIPSDIPMTQNKSEIKDSKEMASCSGFVRLSDLDKTPAKNETNESEDSGRPRSLSYRMSTSIPEMSWVESKLAVNRTHGPCQVRTLASRKFTSIMSTSLPAKHKSPIEEFANECEGEGIISESDLSSMQSSMGRSGADVSTEETETSSFANGKPYNRLGEDLLRMFLEEINPDVTIEINGRRIRAHKCILSSRCQYFAAILSGGWIESAGNVISLQGYSYSAVHFALCHIYSGENNIPESISIVELATLADMLCLEGLKEVIGYTIKVKYCHLFHKPCQICAVGVLECMPLAAAYGLDEVYRKSLRWITRHFVRIWPCKAFATLPRELMDKCYHQHIVHMSADNVLQTIMDCDKLLATLPNARWAEPVFKLVSNLLETALKFLSDNFSSVLSNDSFQALGGDLTWNISRLEDNVLASADRLPPDQACKSYSKLYKMHMWRNVWLKKHRERHALQLG
ncbi:hypothetical protein PV327_004606 [Microctonus hyperodae]|uniref:BTB domain-containing protein n=1 Tax=Microctonus hyperodae TaxID=165561 RepID=A0AA39FCT2_MICHY|nr:hypothetical protein PV327_004606 [Microctonus hyperodae]